MTATPTMSLKQDGEKLTGEYVSARYGKFPIAGTSRDRRQLLVRDEHRGERPERHLHRPVDKDGGDQGLRRLRRHDVGTFSAAKEIRGETAGQELFARVRHDLLALLSTTSSDSASCHVRALLARTSRSASSSSRAAPARAGPSSAGRGAGTRSRRSTSGCPPSAGTSLQVLDGVVEIVRVHVADIDVQLVRRPSGRASSSWS